MSPSSPDPRRGLRYLFAAILAERFDYPCPAVQDACDRLASDYRDRATLLAWLRSDAALCPQWGFMPQLLSAWKAPDVLLVTGRTRGEWLRLVDDASRPFCACGRRHSECDGSRAGCPKARAATLTAGVVS